MLFGGQDTVFEVFTMAVSVRQDAVRRGRTIVARVPIKSGGCNAILTSFCLVAVEVTVKLSIGLTATLQHLQVSPDRSGRPPVAVRGLTFALQCNINFFGYCTPRTSTFCRPHDLCLGGKFP